MSLFLFYYITSQGVSGVGGLGNGLLLPGIERGNSMVQEDKDGKVIFIYFLLNIIINNKVGNLYIYSIYF